MKDTQDKLRVNTIIHSCINGMITQIPCTRLRNYMYEQLKDKLWNTCRMVYNQIKSEIT